MPNTFNKAKSDSLTFEEITRIIESYGTLLEDRNNPIFMDESVLPAEKSNIKQALRSAILAAESEEYRKAFTRAYLFLSFFLPGVGVNSLKSSPHTNIEVPADLSDKMNKEMKELQKELKIIERQLRLQVTGKHLSLL